MKFASETPGSEKAEESIAGSTPGERRVVDSGIDERTGGRYNIVQHFNNEDAENRRLFAGEVPEGFDGPKAEEQKVSLGERLRGFFHKLGSRRSGEVKNEPIAWQEETPKVGEVVESEWEKPKQEVVVNTTLDVQEEKKEESKPRATLSTGVRIRKHAVTDKSGDVWENDIAESKPREVLTNEGDFDKKKVKNKKPQKEIQEGVVEEEAETATEAEGKAEGGEKKIKKTKSERMVDALVENLESGSEAMDKVFDLFKDKLGQIVPRRINNFFEARDIRKKVEKSEVFQNREKAMERSVELTHSITALTEKIANIDSHITGEKLTLSDAGRQKKLRIELADGEPDLIADAESEFEEVSKVINEKLIALKEEKQRLVLKREALVEEKEENKGNIREDSKRLKTLVEGNIDNIKANIGFENTVEKSQDLKRKLSEQQKEADLINSRISAIEASIERGGYKKEKVKEYKLKLKEMKSRLGVVNESLEKTRKSLGQVEGVIQVLNVRFGAVEGILQKMGVIEESKINTSEMNQGAPTKEEKKAEAQVAQPVTSPIAPTQSRPTNASEGQDDIHPDDVPEGVHEQTMASENEAPKRNLELWKISKQNFESRLKQIKKNSRRPVPDDISQLLKFAGDYLREKGLSSSSIKTEKTQLKLVSERDAKIALLDSILSKLN